MSSHGRGRPYDLSFSVLVCGLARGRRLVSDLVFFDAGALIKVVLRILPEKRTNFNFSICIGGHVNDELRKVQRCLSLEKTLERVALCC